MITAGIIEGSSVMGYTQEEYESLSFEEKLSESQRVTEIYREAGADYVIRDIRGLLDL